MTNFVVFGASGDLAQNYLYPSLFHLWEQGIEFNYFGFGRSAISADDYVSFVDKNIHHSEFSSRFTYVSGSYDAAGFANLLPKLSSDTIFYFALPTRLEIISHLISAVANSPFFDAAKTRLVIEKPFGTDLASAEHLMKFLESTVGSTSVFLVDHYLTKELVRNIVSLRFSNPIFAHLWNGEYIKEINLTAVESRGIDERGEYYDRTGALRDMVQNHCLQLIALMTMDCPHTLDSKRFTAEKLAVLDNLSLYDSSSKSLRLGQYEGYQNEPGVDPKSNTETLVQAKFKLDSPNWQGVPINLTTGKKMESKLPRMCM